MNLRQKCLQELERMRETKFHNDVTIFIIGIGASDKCFQYIFLASKKVSILNFKLKDCRNAQL